MASWKVRAPALAPLDARCSAAANGAADAAWIRVDPGVPWLRLATVGWKLDLWRISAAGARRAGCEDPGWKKVQRAPHHDHRPQIMVSSTLSWHFINIGKKISRDARQSWWEKKRHTLTPGKPGGPP